MKPKFYPVLLLLTLTLACSKEKEEFRFSDQNFVGKYIYAGARYTAPNSSNTIDVTNDPIYFNPCVKGNSYDFKGDGGVTILDFAPSCFAYATNTSWSLADNVLTIDGTTRGMVVNFTKTGFELVVPNHKQAGDRYYSVFTAVR